MKKSSWNTKEDVERHAIIFALNICGTVKEAASLLQMKQSEFCRKAKRYRVWLPNS